MKRKKTTTVRPRKPKAEPAHEPKEKRRMITLKEKEFTIEAISYGIDSGACHALLKLANGDVAVARAFVKRYGPGIKHRLGTIKRLRECLQIFAMENKIKLNLLPTYKNLLSMTSMSVESGITPDALLEEMRRQRNNGHPAEIRTSKDFRKAMANAMNTLRSGKHDLQGRAAGNAGAEA